MGYRGGSGFQIQKTCEFVGFGSQTLIAGPWTPESGTLRPETASPFLGQQRELKFMGVSRRSLRPPVEGVAATVLPSSNFSQGNRSCPAGLLKTQRRGGMALQHATYCCAGRLQYRVSSKKWGILKQWTQSWFKVVGGFVGWEKGLLLANWQAGGLGGEAIAKTMRMCGVHICDL